MAKVKECIEISGNNFEERIKGKIVAVDFWASWCMPCLMMSPVIDELADKFKNKIEFCKVNIDENQKLAEKYSVMSIPTLVIFKNGKEINRFVGSQSADVLEEKIKKIL